MSEQLDRAVNAALWAVLAVAVIFTLAALVNGDWPRAARNVVSGGVVLVALMYRDAWLAERRALRAPRR